MKRTILRLANSFLNLFNAKIYFDGSSPLNMSSAIQRICTHDIPIKSIIDIGASNCKWSIDTMEFFPNASYLSIEPLYERKDALEKLKKKYNTFDYVLCVAGAEDNQEILLNVSDDLDGSTVNGIGGEKRKLSGKWICFSVEVILNYLHIPNINN